MKVLITGATGLVGSEIVDQCHNEDIEVHYLTTSKDKLKNRDNYKGFYWDPITGVIDNACLTGVDVIINLAGAPISKRWTSGYKNEILQSRIQSLQLLKDTLSTNDHTVKHIVSASAIGVYPDSLINYYEEDYPEVSTSFLGRVVERWENAVDEFSALQIKVSKIRTGLVLSNKGGALVEMAKPIKLGAGAPFGNGKQWQSWIHIEDLAKLYIFVINNELEGVYNGVAPNAVINEDVTKCIAKTLEKPLLLPNIPEFVMKLALGEMHILLFESQRVSSKKIEEQGYNFQYSNLHPALEDLLT